MTLRLRISTLLVLAALSTGPAAAARADTGGATPTPPVSAPVVPGGLLGGMVTWQGSLPGAHTARVERPDAVSGTWAAVVSVPVADDGTFDATWLGDALGSYTVRAVPDDGQQEAATAEAPLTARITVYRPVKATWYGPGFFGRRTACGSRMT